MILVDSTYMLVRDVAVVTFKHRLTAAAGFVDRVFCSLHYVTLAIIFVGHGPKLVRIPTCCACNGQPVVSILIVNQR